MHGQRPARNPKLVQPSRFPEEQTILGHGEASAAAGQGQGVDGPKGGDHDQQPHAHASQAGKNRVDCQRCHSVARRRLNRMNGEHGQVAEIAEQVQHDDQRRSDSQRQGQVALWIANLAGNERDVMP